MKYTFLLVLAAACLPITIACANKRVGSDSKNNAAVAIRSEAVAEVTKSKIPDIKELFLLAVSKFYDDDDKYNSIGKIAAEVIKGNKAEGQLVIDNANGYLSFVGGLEAGKDNFIEAKILKEDNNKGLNLILNVEDSKQAKEFQRVICFFYYSFEDRKLHFASYPWELNYEDKSIDFKIMQYRLPAEGNTITAFTYQFSNNMKPVTWLIDWDGRFFHVNIKK